MKTTARANRSWAPWPGSRFTGLVLFGVYISAIGSAPTDGEGEAKPEDRQYLPAPVLTVDEKKSLLDAVARSSIALTRCSYLCPSRCPTGLLRLD